MKMDRDRLKDILSIPSYTGHENDVREYINVFAIRNMIPQLQDERGNIFLKKGKLEDGETYPCIVAHMDTVYDDQKEMVGTNSRLLIQETKDGDKTILSAKDMGIGGDDKCGIAIALELLLKYDKMMAAFYVEEEAKDGVACAGSNRATDFYTSQAGYFLQFDAPTDNWVSEYNMGVKPYSKQFMNRIKPILDKYGQTKFSDDPFTDVWALTQQFDVSCINLFAGYMNQHEGVDEYVVVEYVEKALNMAVEIIDKLGNKEQSYKGFEIHPSGLWLPLTYSD